MLPLSTLCPSLYFSLYFSLYQPPGPLFKGKEVGAYMWTWAKGPFHMPTPNFLLRLSGAYIVQNPNYYLNIIILLKTKSTN